MKKPKKICCRITPRRVMGAILVAASLVNLTIVGAVFKASPPGSVPTITASQTPALVTETFFPPTATQVVLTSTNVFTPTSTFTATYTATLTPTPTFTATLSPSATPCIPQSAWPVYVVQDGDVLSSLAVVTRSSVPELMLANCLPDTRIYVGQQLHVPYLPIITATYTPTYTPIVPTNGPTVFLNPSVCYDTTVGTSKLTYTIFLSVTPYDLEGVHSLLAFYEVDGGTWNQLTMASFGSYYAASAILANAPTGKDEVYYYFQATDNVGNVFTGIQYHVPLTSCIVIN